MGRGKKGGSRVADFFFLAWTTGKMELFFTKIRKKCGKKGLRGNTRNLILCL